MKLKSALLVILISLCSVSMQAQSMAVNLLNGSQSTYNLTSVLNLTFNSGNFSVKTASGTIAYPLTNFKNLKFSQGVYTSVIAKTTASNFLAFPNPFQNNLLVNINGLITSDASISIYSKDGKLMKSLPVSGSNITLELSDLSAGIYFCSLYNSGEIKTIKIIKE